MPPILFINNNLQVSIGVKFVRVAYLCQQEFSPANDF